LAAVMMLVLAGLLWHRLPSENPRPGIHYLALLSSVVRLVWTEPVLQLRAVIGALLFATFNVIWTSLSFLLAGPPYNYSPATIGLFGLLGAVGALAAAFSGHLADHGWERRVTGGSLILLVACMGLMTAGSQLLWALIVGVVLGDMATQAVHIQNQQLIFAVDPAARSRLNTGYMVIYFTGGAIGSASTGLAWAMGGWGAVMVLGLLYSGAALVVWAVSVIISDRKTRRAIPSIPGEPRTSTPA